MTPEEVDRDLYYWIRVANESRERFLLSPGFIEESIARLKSVMGDAFLATVLERKKQPVGLLVGEEINPLRLWLGSPGVDKHVLQVLEFCSLLKTFESDPRLSEKLSKLRQDAFHPVFFELAMAQRLKASASPDGEVSLCAETEDAIGDFSLRLGKNLIACECSRLGFGPLEEDQFRILNFVYDYIADFAKTKPGKRLIKIKVTEPLTSQVYNPRLIGRIKKAINGFDRNLSQGRSSDNTIEVLVEALSPNSEKIPFEMIDGRVTDVVGTPWSSAVSIGDVSGHTEREVAELYRKGMKVEPNEHTRVLVEFPRAKDNSDPYKRLRQKINAKIKQTKLTDSYAGKLIFVECPFDLRDADLQKLQKQINDEMRQSSSTAGIFVCKREANPHYRHHYSVASTINSAACAVLPGLDATLKRFLQRDSQFDAITGDPYLLSWEDARKRVASYAGPGE
jgi:hypothetical protein